ncbi:MAG TPA: mechanosensitive ion channel family protein, partial [Nitrospiraceae bacterium]|nr:mechanosensitive ion channel family protein [Nitrospiraceae bacterium]
RRNKTVSRTVLFAGLLAWLLTWSALLLHGEWTPVSPLILSAVDTAAYLSVAFLLLAVLDALVIGEYLIERKGRYVPDVVRRLMLGAGVVAAGVIILRLVMNINLVALVALPTVAAAVVGVALKDTIARFFAGIELGKMLKEGDWITTLEREGKVTHIGLEHLTLMTRERDYVTLPNDTVIQSGVTNYSRPTTTHLCSIYVEAAYRSPPGDICAILMDAAAAVDGVLSDPKPVAMVTAFNESGIQYRLKFPIADYARRPEIESAVRTYVWNAFSRKGIEIPFPQRVIQQAVLTERSEVLSSEDIRRHLAGVDFLATLAPPQLETIARGSRTEHFLPGERVVRQGDPGQELYVIVEGRADVMVEQNGLSSLVSQLTPGQFFGEMSLLTGEPRSATVTARTPLKVLVVGKDALVQLVQQDRVVIERIGAVVARRHASTLAAKQELDREASKAAGRHPVRPLIERIQNFLWGQAKV